MLGENRACCICFSISFLTGHILSLQPHSSVGTTEESKEIWMLKDIKSDKFSNYANLLKRVFSFYWKQQDYQFSIQFQFQFSFQPFILAFFSDIRGRADHGPIFRGRRPGPTRFRPGPARPEKTFKVSGPQRPEKIKVTFLLLRAIWKSHKKIKEFSQNN